MNNMRNLFSVALLLALALSVFSPLGQTAAAATLCDAVQFVADVTVPDGTTYAAGTSFNKTWRIKNVGTCTWTTDYSLVFVDGAAMAAPASLKLPQSVAPGATIDLTVSMTAPNAAGTYRGNWQLKNASGVLFGIGANANKSFWVEIIVSGAVSGTGYDFVANAASAQWVSGAGNLTFPGADTSAGGFALKQDAPKFENGSTSPAPALLTVPQNVENGTIAAVYPAFRVQTGDRFETTVGCEQNATSCWANFRLEYQIGSGAPQLFWSFNEKYEGQVYKASFDLSRLAGQDVKFILRVNAAGPAAGDRALWGAPKIVRGGAAVTVTPAPVTVTPITPAPVTVTPAPSACDKALFVADTTVPDGTVFAPSTNFVKTWRIKNVGTCTWTTAYKLVFVSGDPMGSITEQSLTSTIAPNTTVDFSVNLTSPAANGTYRGYWQFKNDKGQLFGIGSASNKPFWVEIVVNGGATALPPTPAAPTATPVTVTTGYDFAQNFTSASWSSGAGILTVPGTDGDAKGFALSKTSVKMENSAESGVITLLTAPQNVNNGYIQAVYPAIRVQSGDRFQATIGCEYNATSCYVSYKLSYQVGGGAVQTLWSFNEKYEGMVYTLNLDLSSLAGKDVQFILMNGAAGSASGDRALWVNPRLVRLSAPTPLPTFTPAATATP